AVNEEQIRRDLSMNEIPWENSIMAEAMRFDGTKQVSVYEDVYEATKDAHGICVLTEWDEFKEIDYQRVFESMEKPAFVFDGRNVLDVDKLREIGFIVYSIGKPLKQWQSC
ncbi:UDP-glucose 6-dehydrogenase 1, variant 2, partial [Lathyrus oleraceus]